MTNRVFIFGAGYSGQAIACELAPESASVAGTSRSAEKVELLSGLGIHPFSYSGEGFAPETRRALEQTSHLIVSIAPGEARDPVLADLQDAGRDALPALRWIGYLSTVGVYGDHGCEWVDEESECRPVSSRSRRRLEVEDAWMRFGEESGVPVAVLRLSGIYGPGRNALVNLSEGKSRRIVKPGQVFNRIHVDDIAGAVRHLVRGSTGGVFNVTDDEPSPPQDVVAYAAKLMGVEAPPEIPFEDADLGPMARSFYSECKRASNKKLKGRGYGLRYPNYRAALEAMWASGTWKGQAAVNML